jgi:hypothetical protein
MRRSRETMLQNSDNYEIETEGVGRLAYECPEKRHN